MVALLPSLAQSRTENDGRDHADPPVVPYYHMWTGVDGHSRINVAVMQAFGLKSVGGKAMPQWTRPFPGDVVALNFATLPVGWIGEWHETPKPQWVVPLSGRWFIETQDGNRAEMGPGDIHFGQDIGTAERGGTMGHRSGTIGDMPCVQLIVQFATSPASASPHRFG